MKSANLPKRNALEIGQLDVKEIQIKIQKRFVTTKSQFVMPGIMRLGRRFEIFMSKNRSSQTHGGGHNDQ